MEECDGISKKAAVRLRNVETSAWDANRALLDEYKPVDLSTGCPDYEPPTFVCRALADAALAGGAVNQYSPLSGHPRLLNALSRLYSPELGRRLDPAQELLVCSGGFDALFTAIMSFVDEGDEVLLIEPYFSCFETMIRMAGGRPVTVSLRLDTQPDQLGSGQFTLDADELRRAFSVRTKLLLLNSPHNPTGKVFTADELRTLAALCVEFDVIALMDDVYEWFVYAPARHGRMCRLPGMWNRCITIGMAGKTFGVTGWKLSWVYGAAGLIRAMTRFHGSSLYVSPTPIQEAVAIAIEQSLRHGFLEELAERMRAKRDHLVRLLRRAGLRPIVPDGGLFVLADAGELQERLQLVDGGQGADYALVDWLVRHKRVLAMPASAFYSEANRAQASRLLRFCFLRKEETLDQAEELLAAVKV